ncbi:hypothetical protein ABI59_22335 [Acidobacteria bacterium Mor1]|nr:hypothetical protein ABI59_22335 [Acidobacteria bacterium Mor1]
MPAIGKNEIAAALDRYRPLIDDWPAAVETFSAPLPVTLWANPERGGLQALRQASGADGLDSAPTAWCPELLRFPAGTRFGIAWWYLAGLAHSQEEVSLLPVEVLNPRPGERVLDLCAAPGGKTARIAFAVGSGGTVVANDVNMDRLRALRSTVDRLGLTNISVTRHDAAAYPKDAGTYDRVLVDAPCSDEGTLRKNRKVAQRIGKVDYERMARRQRAILMRGAQLCKVGGEIVYSTCTLAPEENEAVIDQVVREAIHLGLEILPVEVPGFKLSPGVDSWNGQRFAPEVTLTARAWPHHNDTGGFFIARLRKTADLYDRSVEALPPEPSDSDIWREVAGERFGIDQGTWQPYTIHRQNKRGLHLVNAAHTLAPRPEPESVGMFFIKERDRYPKLSTAAAMTLGPLATRNVIDLDESQVTAFHDRETFPLDAAQQRACDGTGYVMARYRVHVLGIGLYLAEKGTLASYFPKRWTPKGSRP